MGTCCSDQKKAKSANVIPADALAETQKHIRFSTVFEHPRNPHNIHFKIRAVGTRIQATNLNYDNFCHTLMLNNPIVANQTTCYSVRQGRTKMHNILIGVATEAVLGINDAFQHKEAITYSTYSGDIWENEEGKAGGRKINDGQTVKIAVDTRNWTITWKVEEEQLGLSNIAEHLRAKGLYFVVMMFNKNDTVQIALE